MLLLCLFMLCYKICHDPCLVNICFIVKISCWRIDYFFQTKIFCKINIVHCNDYKNFKKMSLQIFYNSCTVCVSEREINSTVLRHSAVYVGVGETKFRRDGYAHISVKTQLLWLAIRTTLIKGLIIVYVQKR